MKILVTGVGGFIGSHVARKLISDGHTVVGIDDFSNGSREIVPHGVDLIVHDLADQNVIQRLPPDAEVILHLAGQSSGEISFDDPVADMNKNVASTLNLIKYGISINAKRLVYASSMSVYGDAVSPAAEDVSCSPLSCYGNGKLTAEQYLKIYGDQLPFVAFRMFNVYGPGQDMTNLRQGMVSIFLAQALTGKTVIVKGSLERFRDFIFIEDVVDIWCRSVTGDQMDGQIVNLGTGEKTTVGKLLETIKLFIPEMSWKQEGSTPGDQSGIFADTNKLRQLAGIEKFTSLEEGMARFFEWADRQ